MDVENILATATENLSVRRAFGTAYEKDGMLIIPVALVAGGGGGGTGTARTRSGDSAARPDGPPGAGSAGQDAASPDPGRTDAGGGFGGLVLPSGAYVVKGRQVRWVPAVDATIVVLASLSLVRVLAVHGPAGAGATAGHDPYVRNEAFLHSHCHITQFHAKADDINLWMPGPEAPVDGGQRRGGGHGRRKAA